MELGVGVYRRLGANEATVDIWKAKHAQLVAANSASCLEGDDCARRLVAHAPSRRARQSAGGNMGVQLGFHAYSSFPADRLSVKSLDFGLI